jgi:hypothetical protein
MLLDVGSSVAIKVVSTRMAKNRLSIVNSVPSWDAPGSPFMVAQDLPREQVNGSGFGQACRYDVTCG